MADCFEIRNLSVPVNTLVEVLPRVFETMKFRPVGASMQANGIYRQNFISTLPSFEVFRASKPQIVTAIVRPQDDDQLELELQFSFDKRFRWALHLANLGAMVSLACVVVGFLVLPTDFVRSHGGLVFPSLACLMGLPVWGWLWLWTRLKSLAPFCDSFYRQLNNHVLPASSIVARQLEHPESSFLQTLSAIGVYAMAIGYIVTQNEWSGIEILSYLGILSYASMIITPLLGTKIPFERSLSVLTVSLVTLFLAAYSFGVYSFFATAGKNGPQVLRAIEENRIGTIEVLLVFSSLGVLVFVGIFTIPLLCVRPLQESSENLEMRKGQPIRILESMSVFPFRFRFAMALMWAFCLLATWGSAILSIGLIERMATGSKWLVPSIHLDIWFSNLLMVADIIVPEDFGPVYVHAMRAIFVVGIISPPVLVVIRMVMVNLKTTLMWLGFRIRSRELNDLANEPWENTVRQVCRECHVEKLKVVVDVNYQGIDAAILDSPIPGMRPILYLSQGAIDLDQCGELWILIAHELGHLVKKHSWKYSMMRFISRWTVVGDGFFDSFLKSPILTELEADDFAVERYDHYHKSTKGFQKFEHLMEILDNQQYIQQTNELRYQGMAIRQGSHVGKRLKALVSGVYLKSWFGKLVLALRMLDQLLFNSASFAYVYADIKTRLALLRSKRQQQL